MRRTSLLLWIACGALACQAEPLELTTPDAFVGPDASIADAVDPADVPTFEDARADGGDADQLADADTDAGESFDATPSACNGVNAFGEPVFCMNNCDWCWDMPLPFGNTINTMWTSPSGVTWGAGHNFIAHWTEDQFDVEAWPMEILELSGAADDDIWAVGRRGQILHYDGTSWTLVQDTFLAQRESLSAASIAPNGDIWAIGPDNDAISHWDGTVWSTTTLGGVYRDIWAAAHDDVWVVGHLLLAHYDQGTWSSVPAAEGLRTVTGTVSSRVWVGGEGGRVAVYDGNSWADHSLAVTELVEALWVDSSNVWAGGSGAFRFDGTTWTSVSWPNLMPLAAIDGRDQNDLWLAGYAELRHFDGTNIEFENSSARTPLGVHEINGVLAFSGDDAWAVGDNGVVLHKSGGVWADVGLSRQVFDVFAISGLAPDDMWIAGWDGLIARWDGISLQRQNSGLPTYPIRNIHVVSSTCGYAMTDDGVLFYDGTTWSIEQVQIHSLKDLFGFDNGEAWVVGQDGVERRQNGAWTPIAPGYFMAIWGSAPNDVWIGGINELLHWDGSSISTSTLAFTFIDLSGDSDGLWAIGALPGTNDPTVARITAGGTTITPLPISGDPRGISVAPDGHVFAVGNGFIFHHAP